jgi:uncharacterized protein (DUF433 family)
MIKQESNPLSTRYTIVESEIGPLISESRCTVFDVMELADAGEPLYAITTILNLTPLQVEIALDYVAQHRGTLAPQLAEIMQRRAEREEYYRAIADKIFEQIAQEPITRRRAEFVALRERNAAEYTVAADADLVE